MAKTEAEDISGFKTPPPNVFGTSTSRLARAITFSFSRLALQLIAASLIGLTLLLLAILSVADLRTGTADAVMQSLLVQSDVVVAGLDHTQAVHTPLLVLVKPEDTQAAGGSEGRPNTPPRTEIDRPALETLLGQMLQGSQTDVRVFGADGDRLVDSTITLRHQNGPSGDGGIVAAIWDWLAGSLLAPALPAEPADDAPVSEFAEVGSALGGVKTAIRRTDSNGNIIVTVAKPVFEGDDVIAVMQFRSDPMLIANIARSHELAIVRSFLIAAAVAVAICLVLAATITRPIRRLAAAADRIRRGGASTPMPEIADGGEIGELSRILRDMTVALYSRIDSIEAFAGEVAHELKNPLTSLRSAVETLPKARQEKSRNELLDVIQHDVRRIDRLISDISDASKLDAELNRYRYSRFDLIDILQAVVNTQAELAEERGQTVELVVHGGHDDRLFLVLGNDSRLGQVFTNLIDNARSFTPDGGRVVTTVQRFSSFIEAVVDDEGPGIDEEVLERVFERFYTDRSGQASFGDNSGLGLAICRQIIEAHNGEIFAENRYRTTLGPNRDVAGARFTVRLPTLT